MQNDFEDPPRTERMEKALVAVEANAETKALVREAGKLAAGVGAELVLLHVTSDEAFEEREGELSAIPGIDLDYGVASGVEEAEGFARAIGEEVLGDDYEFTAVGRIGDDEREILAEARSSGADHLFIHGKQRSPAGKAVFGDLAQAIILGFDGPVTVTTS